MNPERLLQEIDWIRALARDLVFDENRAEDLAQEALLAALQTPSSPAGSLRAWLARVLRYRAVSHYRSESRRKRRELGAAARESIPSAGEALERAELQRVIVNAVFSLEDPYRSTVVLVYFEGLEAAQIAEQEGVSPVTVRTRLKRALDQLRARLDRELGERKKWQLALAPLLELRAPSSTSPAGPVAGKVGWLAMEAALMSMKKTFIAGIAAVLLLGGAIVCFLTFQPPDKVPAAESPAHPRNATAARSRAPASPAAQEKTEIAASLPPAVDLDAADRDLDLFGIVLDGAGTPIGGAEVEVTGDSWRRLRLPSSTDAKQRPMSQKTRSAADGTFLMRLTRGEVVDLVVSHVGFGGRELPDRVAGEFVEVVLPRATRLEVVVRDEKGEAVSKARLVFAGTDASRAAGGQGRSCAYREGTTDGDGRLLFADVQPGSGTLGVAHPLLGGTDFQKVECPEGETTRVEVAMRAGRPIRGRVTSSRTGQPIAGARVGAFFSLDNSVLTDGEGRYTFRGWTRERAWDLHVAAEGYGRRNKRVGDTQEEVDFELNPAFLVTGSILRSDGRPAAGALVAAVASHMAEDGRQELDNQTGLTAADGRFTLTGLRTDLPHTLIIHADGSGKYLLDFDGPATDGKVDLGVIELPAGRRIEGIALDGDGNPLPDARVTIDGQNDDRSKLRPGAPAALDTGYGRIERRWTDDLGRFRFRDLSPGTYHLTLESPGLPRLERAIVLAGDDLLGVVLGNEDGRSLRVLVKDGSGAGIPGVSIEARWRESGTKGGGRGEARLAVRSDAVGKAVLHGLPDSVVRIALDEDHEHEYLPPNERARDVRPAGQEIVYVLEKAARLAGTVLSPEGDPLPRLQLIAKSALNGETLAAAYTGPDGAFTMKLRGGTPVDLSVTGRQARPDGLDEERTAPFRGEARGITAPASGIALRTQRIPCDRSLTVVVVDPEGNPVPSIAVHASGPHLALLERPQTTGEDGRLALKDLSHEALQVSVGRLPPAAAYTNVVPPDLITVVPEGQEVYLRCRRK